MNIVSFENFISQLSCEVYPITLLKFMLNKKKLKSLISKLESNNEYNKKLVYKIDNSDCNECKEKASGILCRKHTSINRILNADKILYDKFSDFYFYKNEIFKFVNNKLIIIYCPHTKLIQGKLTAAKVRKFSVIIIENIAKESLNVHNPNIVTFSSNLLFDKYMSCWFDDIFTIVTIPEDKQFSSFCLIPNK